jgi:glutamine---fructose-6-phosphate transaminase (isomerizing)
MIQHDRAQTAMAREIREIPLTTERLLAEQDLVATVAHRIRHANPRVVVISGRGGSGNAGTFLRYLFETRAGLHEAALGGCAVVMAHMKEAAN